MIPEKLLEVLKHDGLLRDFSWDIKGDRLLL
jgi:hypothetical protein